MIFPIVKCDVNCKLCIAIFTLLIAFAVEYKGHSLLEGARQADLARVKKYLAVDIVNFKHPYNGDSALVSLFLISLLTVYEYTLFILFLSNGVFWRWPQYFSHVSERAYSVGFWCLILVFYEQVQLSPVSNTSCKYFVPFQLIAIIQVHVFFLVPYCFECLTETKQKYNVWLKKDNDMVVSCT